jgi:hypothetical protein
MGSANWVVALFTFGSIANMPGENVSEDQKENKRLSFCNVTY